MQSPISENAENLIVGHLAAIRADLGGMRREQRDIKVRLVSIENPLGQMHKGIALLHEDIAGFHLRFDGLSDRVERIERRLELREAV